MELKKNKMEPQIIKSFGPSIAKIDEQAAAL